jgi:glycosyltransferase involved in cell wall biosynthesis
MVHKGLDLLLGTFISIPEFTLYVAGPVSGEPDFVKAYNSELYQYPNIKTLGWLDVEGPVLEQVMDTCVGVILPSCSEGGGGSVITGMHAGLLPVVSYEASVDVHDFGILLSEISMNAIREAVTSIASMSAIELKSKSLKAWQYAREFHTREKFEADYRQFMTELYKFKPDRR